MFVHGNRYRLAYIWVLVVSPFCASLTVRVLESPLSNFLLLVFVLSIILWGLVVSEMKYCLPDTNLGPKARYFDF